MLLGNCVTGTGQRADVSWVLLSKGVEGRGWLLECPITKLLEISGFDICRVCVCEFVRKRDRDRETEQSTVMKLRSYQRVNVQHRHICHGLWGSSLLSFYFFWLLSLPHVARL